MARSLPLIVKDVADFVDAPEQADVLSEIEKQLVSLCELFIAGSGKLHKTNSDIVNLHLKTGDPLAAAAKAIDGASEDNQRKRNAARMLTSLGDSIEASFVSELGEID